MAPAFKSEGTEPLSFISAEGIFSKAEVSNFATFYVNEAEKAALDDLMAVLGVKNQSAFIRGRVFGAYNELTAEQKAKLAEAREWRAKEDNREGRIP